jgi:hypothetical protein
MTALMLVFLSTSLMYQKSILLVRSVLPLMTCFLPAFMLLGIVPAVASAVFHALPWRWLDSRCPQMESGPSVVEALRHHAAAAGKLGSAKEVLEILERGIASMAPGRTLEWVLGAAHSTVDWDANNEYKVRLEADGPLGPLDPLEYVIILSNLRGSRAVASGNLRAVALELHEIGKATDQLNRSIKQLQIGPPPEPPMPMEPTSIEPSIESSIPMEPLSGDDS